MVFSPTALFPNFPSIPAMDVRRFCLHLITRIHLSKFPMDKVLVSAFLLIVRLPSGIPSKDNVYAHQAHVPSLTARVLLDPMALTLLVAELVAHLKVVPLLLLPMSPSMVIYHDSVRVSGMFSSLVLLALSLALSASSTDSKTLPVFMNPEILSADRDIA